MKKKSIQPVKMEKNVLLGPWPQESQTSDPLSNTHAPK